jgi:hypothetical protein
MLQVRNVDMLLQVHRQTLHQLLLKCGLIVPLMCDVCAYVLIRQHTHSLSLYIVAFCFCRTDCCACCGTGRRSRYIYIYIAHTHTHTHTHTLPAHLLSDIHSGHSYRFVCWSGGIRDLSGALSAAYAMQRSTYHTSACVSIRQQMSAYVSICQRAFAEPGVHPEQRFRGAVRCFVMFSDITKHHYNSINYKTLK